jgi:hypothetical protein
MTGDISYFFLNFFMHFISLQVGNAVTLPISLNDNSVLSVASVSTPDAAVKAEYDDACLQSVQRGPCKAAFVRFYFNTTSKMCKPFLYGGEFGIEI